MSVQRPGVAVERVQCEMRIPLVDLKGQYGQVRTDVVKALWDVLEEMDLRLGPNVQGFESEFAAFCGARHAVGVGSGSDALYLALRACGVCAGDEVITVANGYLSTTEAILRLGAVPVYVDVEPRTYTLDPAALEPAIGERTRAVVPVHLYGQVADMDAIREVAQHFGLSVVEDASHAHGAEYRGRRAGSLADAAAFSLSMTKNLGAFGDAGVVTTSSRAVADEVRRLRNHGIAPAGDQHAAIIDVARDGFGINSRLDELQAAVLRVKLRHLDAWNAQRRRHARAYDQLLAGTAIVPPAARDDAAHVYHLYVVQVPDRERARGELRDRGVETAVHYPVPLYRRGGSTEIGRVAGDLRVTEELAGRVLSLPMYPELVPEQLAGVAESLRLAAGAEGSALVGSTG